MPTANLLELNSVLDDFFQKNMPRSIQLSKEEKELAKKQSEDYLKNKTGNVHDMNPLIVYYIIKELPEDEQIKFIEDNINYIRENDEDIFLYDMNYPENLATFFSLETLQKIKNIDSEICKKIINRSFGNMVKNFSEEDYVKFYTYFFEEINNKKNNEFISCIYFHNRHYFDKPHTKEELNFLFEKQQKCNNDFINFIREKYSKKVLSFTGEEVISFLSYIDDKEIYQKVVDDNKDKISAYLELVSESTLGAYLVEQTRMKQTILIFTFMDIIIGKKEIKKFIDSIDCNIITKIYNSNKSFFKDMELKDWIKYRGECYKSGNNKSILEEDFQKILDDYEIENIEALFEDRFFYRRYADLSALKYVENKYRNQIEITGYLEPINESTSIFSKTYFKNLKELRSLLKTNKIYKSDLAYQQHFALFTKYLIDKQIINTEVSKDLREVDILFYRIVMGASITNVFKVSNIEEITLLNRLGSVEFEVASFTVEQLEKYNVKEYRNLFDKKEYGLTKQLLLKLVLLVGYHYAKLILNIDRDLQTLEHLVGEVNVKNIKLDESGHPILNSKIINLLFSNRNKNIKEMLENKESDLYRYFPRIFNEWQNIKDNKKEQSLKTIIEFLKSDDITLAIKYYRLKGIFKHLGCGMNVVNETLTLHENMLKRTSSTIPRISGVCGEYTYEVLKLQDMEALTVGKRTDCCFTVLGVAKECLKHAVTSKNGRILVVRKNGQLVAHSWLWRNGNLLCLDNIETSKEIKKVDFLDVYLKFSKGILKESCLNEDSNKCLKNITLGVHFDDKIDGIKKYPCFIRNNSVNDVHEHQKLKLPQPLENVNYSDAKDKQYLLLGDGIMESYDCECCYQDERDSIYSFNKNELYKEEYVETMSTIINALRYRKYEQLEKLDDFEMIQIDEYSEAYCNNDWYVLIKNDGTIESYIYSYDKRGYKELETVNIEKAKSLIKKYNKTTIW